MVSKDGTSVPSHCFAMTILVVSSGCFRTHRRTSYVLTLLGSRWKVEGRRQGDEGGPETGTVERTPEGPIRSHTLSGRVVSLNPVTGSRLFEWTSSFLNDMEAIYQTLHLSLVQCN